MFVILSSDFRGLFRLNLFCICPSSSSSESESISSIVTQSCSSPIRAFRSPININFWLFVHLSRSEWILSHIFSALMFTFCLDFVGCMYTRHRMVSPIVIKYMSSISVTIGLTR
eukprot:Lithocolla_globosa_v1_NODE_177_length_5446_cov_18.556483.p4 type:complete len:114 gc:universal NODE_177_length_5446_cov_18.556483:4822-4481(-)